jgi:tetratricopeptide (TPR) repeat protein
MPRSGAETGAGGHGGGQAGAGRGAATAEKRTFAAQQVITIPDASITAEEAERQLGAKLSAAYALSNRGSEMMKRGDADAAIEDYTKSIEIFPTAVAHLNRASARRQKGDREGALDDFKRAIELNPRDATSYYARGQLLLDLGREQEARKDFARCLELDPKMKPLVDSALPGGGRKGESKQP